MSFGLKAPGFAGGVHVSVESCGITNTFETMCGLKVIVSKPELKSGDEPLSDVSGVIVGANA